MGFPAHVKNTAYIFILSIKVGNNPKMHIFVLRNTSFLFVKIEKILKVSAFYLEKQKKIFLKKYDLGRSL